MSKICKTCGGNCSEYGFGKYKCSWCGHKYEEQDFLSEEKASVSDLETFSLLNKARLAIELEYDFKKSLKYSQSVLEKNPSNQEANWLALIAENQIIYIQNDKAKYVPTFLDPERACLVKSKYYSALNSNMKADADAIEKVRLDTVAEFKKVKPYDVFISYKQHETDNPNSETKEAVWARDIYTELKTNPKTRNLNVFFDQKCLSGANAGWEPHIFSAIKSSKCMLILGSSLENINSRWVKNEWKRFIALKACGEKKDFIVLGSDAVNPMLLDEKLQEKQMISNTSGKWIDEIVNRVAGICGKPVKEKEELPPPPPKPRKKVNKKAIAAIVACLCVIVAGVGIWFGVSTKMSADRVSETVALIEYLPDYQVQDYSQYEQAIDEAYTKYNSLSDSEKEKVSNKNVLLNLVEGFNNYRVQTVREAASNISEDTVAETEDLKTAATVYGKLTSDQKAMLTTTERANLDSLVKVYNCVTSINDIKDDVMAKYGEVDTVNKTYLSLSPDYQKLVYNYALVETFNSQYAFYSNLDFTLVTGGYSIALKEGGTLSGKLEIPEQYKGENIVEIPENAFANCAGLTSVSVPDTVKTIGKGAFQGCNKIEQLTLPFVGKSESAAETDEKGCETVLGYIFGYEMKQVEHADRYLDMGVGNVQPAESIAGTVCQFAYVYYNNDWYDYSNIRYYYYYIPTTLKMVTVTKQVKIPVAAFNQCSKITSINYEQPIEDIEDCAFQDCESLTQFNSEIDGVLDLTGYERLLGDYAFSGCSSFTEIKISEVSQIGDYAFQGLNQLTDIVVGNSTKSIGVGAFKDCKKLVNLTLPFVGKSESTAETDEKGCETVLGYIFGYEMKQVEHAAKYLKIGFGNVQPEESIAGTVCQFAYVYYNNDWYDYSNIRYYYYYIPTTLKTVTVTKQVKIPVAAFNQCSKITSINYEQPFEDIEACAFQGCANLAVFNSEVNGMLDLTGYTGMIGDYAFQGLNQLTDIVVGNNTKSIGAGAFKDCKKLVNITLPFVGKSEDAEKYEAVFGYIFGYESKSHSLSGASTTNQFINSETETVEGAIWQYRYVSDGGSAYHGHTEVSYFYYIPTTLKTVIITKQAKIPVAAFNGCNMLASVRYEQPIEAIGHYAFQDCSSLINLNSETNGTIDLTGYNGAIGDYAFKGCVLTTNLIISEVSQIGDYAFQGLNQITEIIVGNNTKSIGMGAFKDCKKLTSLMLPFVGKSETAEKYEAVFGYIFGYESKSHSLSGASTTNQFINSETETVEGAIWQYRYVSDGGSAYHGHTEVSYFYYIPTSLKTVTITKQTTVPLAAFNGCSMLTSIVYKNEIESTGNYAFQNCVKPTVETTGQETV